MAQFDFYSYSVQVFWTLFGFFTFYFFILRFYLINFSSVLKFREKLEKSYLIVTKTSLLINNINLYKVL